LSVSDLKLRLATQYLQNADPQGLLQLTEALLPTLITALSPQERTQLLKALIQNHLGLLLQGVNSSERAALLSELLPTLNAAFDLEVAPGSPGQPSSS